MAPLFFECLGRRRISGKSYDSAFRAWVVLRSAAGHARRNRGAWFAPRSFARSGPWVARSVRSQFWRETSGNHGRHATIGTKTLRYWTDRYPTTLRSLSSPTIMIAGGSQFARAIAGRTTRSAIVERARDRPREAAAAFRQWQFRAFCRGGGVGWGGEGERRRERGEGEGGSMHALLLPRRRTARRSKNQSRGTQKSFGKDPKSFKPVSSWHRVHTADGFMLQVFVLSLSSSRNNTRCEIVEFPCYFGPPCKNVIPSSKASLQVGAVELPWAMGRHPLRKWKRARQYVRIMTGRLLARRPTSP
jgi:hypothetical protein